MGNISRLLGKSVWALIALFAPDIVLSVALHQLLVAKEYRRAVNALSTKKTTWAGERQKDMTLQMAFFAIMGGFCGEVNTVNGPSWERLKVETLRHWRTMDSIRDYSLSEIKDKSKASSIAKTVALLQTCWLLLQCLGRQVEGLHITLLELNTAVHVVLAIVMYLIWWKKPLDIGRSIRFDRSRLGIDDSATTIYMDTVRNTMKSAEKKMDHWVRPIGEKAVKKEDQVTHQNILVAVAICRSIVEAPEEAGRRFRIIPNVIKKYFQSVIKNDIRHAACQHYRLEATVSVSASASRAAYKAAFAVASKTAFQMAHDEIFGTVYKSAADSVSDEKGTNDFKNALIKAYKATRRATFRSSFDAAFTAAIMESGRKDTGLSFGSSVRQTSPSTPYPAAPQVSLLASFRAAHAATRSASRHAVRLVAFDAALGKTGATNAAHIAFRDILNTACRNIIRETNTHSNSNTSKGSEAESDSVSAERADIKSTTNNKAHETAGDDLIEQINPYIAAATKRVESVAGESLIRQFATDAPRVASDVDSAVAIVNRSTSTGVFYAALDAIREAKNAESDLIAKENCKEAEKILDKIDPKEPKTRWQRLSVSVVTAVEMVGDQVIAVPGLFESPKMGLKRDLKEGADEKIQSGRNVAKSENGKKGETHESEKNAETAENDGKHQKGENGESGGKGGSDKGGKYKINEICGSDANSGDQGYKKPQSSENQSAEPFKSSWRKRHRTYLMIFSAVVGAFYGTIHSTKWNSVWFPTVAEHRLWHISCVLGSAAVVPITILLLNPFAPKRLRPLGTALGTVCWVVFVAARVYIIVESFLSLRSLPLDAFKAVRWANAIPHI
ncbi:hypothetical protein BDD12DRAFT_855103 [Trichophaea hybrida]|nr:hypothetical protein BDD12DRAFT_855103 [Trichophaea hybrida]